MKKLLLLAIMLILSGTGFGQVTQEVPRKKTSAEKKVLSEENTKLSKKAKEELSTELNYYNLYSSLLALEQKKLLDYSDSESKSKETLKNTLELKNKRDSIYTKVIIMKGEYMKGGLEKEELEGYFPADIITKGSTGTRIDVKDKFMYLNAVNFDFSDKKNGYVGHFNIYSPSEKQFGFGFNAGILKINYSNNDSITRNRSNIVLINPLDELVVGSKYLSQFNEYKTKYSNMTYGIYMQPLFKISSDAKKTKFFINGHLELLVSKFDIMTEVNTIQSDTMTITTEEEIPMRALSLINKKQTSTINSLNGYFGFGLTWDLYFTENSSLFFQGTTGYTSDIPRQTYVNGTNGNIEIDKKKSWRGFYLVRSYYRHKLSSGSELILGTDIRGILPRFNPNYSLYVGLNLSIEKITDLFK